MENVLELHIKDFRAIADADVVLNGITVIAGVNGAGKSTMSKLLYDTFKYANGYETLVLQEANRELRPYVDILEQLVSYSPRKSYELFRGSLRNMFYNRVLFSSFDEIPQFQDDVKQICKTFANSFGKRNDLRYRLLPPRLQRILDIDGEKDSFDIERSMEELNQHIHSIINKAKKKYDERPLVLLKNMILSDFNQMPRTFSVSEYGEEILKSRVPILHYIRKVLYVDTPMAIGLNPSLQFPKHWNEMNTIIREPAHRGYSRSINNILKKEILKGDIVYDDSEFRPTLKYKRNDDKEFELSECATGVRSMALLQLLLKNKYLDQSTLLIIDEPEAHLHPQWIIEYARIMVLLHKKVGVKFFVTSHSTDMVSAIKYISEKEKISENVTFYVATDAGDNKYTYSCLQNDIEPIFESFNKSFDILEKYAEQ